MSLHPLIIDIGERQRRSNANWPSGMPNWAAYVINGPNGPTDLGPSATETALAFGIAALESAEYRRNLPIVRSEELVPAEMLDVIEVVEPPAGPDLDAWLKEKERIVDLVTQNGLHHLPLVDVVIDNDSAPSLAPSRRHVGADLAAARELGVTNLGIVLHHPKWSSRYYKFYSEIRKSTFQWWERVMDIE